MKRPPPPSPERREAGSGDRFRHTNRADRPSAVALFLRRHKGKLKFFVVIGVLGAGTWAFLSMHGTQGLVAPLKARIEAAIPLKVTEIRVEGANLTSQDAIHEALGISVGDPMLGFDVKTARDRLNDLPFVENATVGRRFSGLIVVHLTERPPFAIWQHKGQFVPIDRDGNPVPDKGMTSRDAQAFMQLPLVVGEGADHAAAELLDALAKTPDVKAHMTAATLINMRRWTLTLKDGASVYLPEAAEPQALTRLEELQKRFDLLNRPVEIIDLRLPDRLTIRERPAPAPVADDAATPEDQDHMAKSNGAKSNGIKSGGAAKPDGQPQPSSTHDEAPTAKTAPAKKPKHTDEGDSRPSSSHDDNEHAHNSGGALPA
ncbi:cell division protein FtsQ/DivIB [Acetobacter sp.]|jgi:cell division protein FtsQ|uniref:cell division protein FtsQ/DivIB n=1 Tax=Acetobacter sp. TaxID=440 RepID=UPI0025C1D80C|nr:cell division protein FtsQ/DivIB [Acetobacter sp.]MCH4089815.1 cell division protein FtsQ/DivIB [Acetobacter sp.]MCI1298511.1 cell division protein FtsQ/DivIB [Acetobacter sp.]MCI1315076.1 cell division protein FtsQ/DivIB [Acetobacter sp.]